MANTKYGMEAGHMPKEQYRTKSQNEPRADVDARDSQHSDTDAVQKWTSAIKAGRVFKSTPSSARTELDTDQASWPT